MTMSKYEVMKLKLKNHMKDPQKNHIIIEGFGKGMAISHEGALTTRRMMEVSHFFLNVVRNVAMWQ